MAERLKAAFINESGRATWLSPIVTIRNNWATVEIGTMIDEWFGNYYYDFHNYDKTKLYDYNFDADSATIQNRYKHNNNELDFYENKTDWWQQIRGAFMNIDTGISKTIIKDMRKLIAEDLYKKFDELKPKDIDFSEITMTLKDLIDREQIDYSDNFDILLNNIKTIGKDIDKWIKSTDKTIKWVTKDISSLKTNISNIISESIKWNKTDIGEVLSKLWELGKLRQDIDNIINSIYRIDWVRDNIAEVIKSRKEIIRPIDKTQEFKDMEKEVKSIEDDEDFISLTKEKWV